MNTSDRNLNALLSTGSVDLRCSTQAGELGEAAAGTAGGADRYILVELPLPWPKPIAAHPMLAELSATTPLMTPDYRVLAIAGTDSISGSHRVLVYESEPATSRFVGRQSLVASADLEATLSQAIEAPNTLEGFREISPDVVDIAICTQGTHDRCCGTMGTQLYNDMRKEPVSKLRLWRTSHTGGHRFAPTAVIFPFGEMWARLDPGALRAVVEQSMEPVEAARLLRGAMALQGREAQLCDVAAFEQYGWDWLRGNRSVAKVERVDDEIIVSLRGEQPDRLVTVVVTEGAPIPVPACGQPLDAATKATPTFQLRRMKAVTTGE